MPPALANAADRLERELHNRGHTHFKTAARGKHITAYVEYDGEKEPRFRLTALGRNEYGVSFATHTGRWEQAPITGSVTDIVEQIADQFGWHLEDWP
jgi:hypothetical protein